MEKRTIQFRKDTLKTVIELSNTDATVCQEFLNACIQYDENEIEPDFNSNIAKTMFHHERQHLDDAKKQYKEMIERKRKAAFKRWGKEVE